MVAHPLAYPVDWADVVILVDGVPYTPSAAQAANYVFATYQVYEDGYVPYNDIPPTDGTLQPGQGFWIKVLPGAIGKEVELLIPATPSIKTSQLNIETELPWYVAVMEWMIPAAQAADSGKDDSRKLVAKGYQQRQNQIAAQSQRLHAGIDWYVRLSVEVPEDELKDSNNMLGQFTGSQSGYDERDLEELPPYGTPYLTLVFPHGDWGSHAGNYATDFHASSSKGKDQWDFEIQTDEYGREAILCWNGPQEVLHNTTLIDLDRKEKYKLKHAELNGCLPVFMDDYIRRFRWETH